MLQCLGSTLNHEETGTTSYPSLSQQDDRLQVTEDIKIEQIPELDGSLTICLQSWL